MVSETLEQVGQEAQRYPYTLLLMRHAQAESVGAEGDRSRPLSLLGRQQASRMGRALTQERLIPDRIACSGALRTRQTLERMLPDFGDGPSVDYRESLYSSGLQAVWDELGQTKADEHRLLILTHEPTVSAGAQLLADTESAESSLLQLDLGMSPASIALFASSEPIAAWTPHSARLLALFGPRDC
ncbi:phosphohistidine phosphatase [Bombiscardovia nodaiensis]|uniref:Phosphohistidine phosphatase n=1 Tax=Bombiscardovia nodaiensis TaxID=2932181 RepID=A0ABN6SAB3_9BIFI|nr:phosphohistidine phosphatase [Bombiscardovia nodaiensis]